MFCCDSYNYFLNMKDNSKMNLEAINILKGLAYSQLEVFIVILSLKTKRAR